MKVVRPITIDNSNLTSNVPESAPAEYMAATTYAAGQQVGVTSGSTVKVYQSLAGSNTGNTPASSPTWWVYIADTYPEYSSVTTYATGARVINAVSGTPTHHVYESVQASNLGNALTDVAFWLDLGAVNRLAMFDNVNGTATTSGNGLDFTVTVTGRADGLALLNMTANTVQVTVTSALGATLYDQTYSMLSDSGITSWYDYFSEARVYGRDLVLSDLPLDSNPVVRVRITSATGPVSCGTAVLGQTRYLGSESYGASASIQDYSKKTADDFGNYSIVERSYAKRLAIKLFAENATIDSTHQLLADLRATPSLWIGTEAYSMTWIFGFYKDFAVEITYPTHSFVTLEIEGLT